MKKQNRINTKEAAVIREIDAWNDDQVKEYRRLTRVEGKPPRVAYLKIKNSRRRSP